MKKCVDEGLLQSYLDGELPPVMLTEVAAHIALCERCCAAARAAEEELALLSGVFTYGPPASVPTEKLRARIGAAIGNHESPNVWGKERGWNIRGWLVAALAAPFVLRPQRAAGYGAAAAAVAFSVIFTVVYLRLPVSEPVRDSVNAPTIVRTSPSRQPPPRTAPPPPAAASTVTELVTDTRAKTSYAGVRSLRPRVTKADGNVSRLMSTASAIEERAAAAPAGNKALFVPGEEPYLRAIASLDQAIKVGGDDALRPALRVEYERNLAVIDEAISESRRAVRRDPNDKSANEFLFSSYQNKIDLMSTIAERAQVATLGR